VASRLGRDGSRLAPPPLSTDDASGAGVTGQCTVDDHNLDDVPELGGPGLALACSLGCQPDGNRRGEQQGGEVGRASPAARSPDVLSTHNDI
jgi:hypothetical protein